MRQTGTRQRQPYLVLDMRTWTSDDKLSSSCLSSSARYAKAETGLLTILEVAGYSVDRTSEWTATAAAGEVG
ncbi:hypothetical protein ALC56_09073 [Trachymyrmex septentrionalis]|uniref:Uncharacterized protein n=1 Tax=Trachymyrmex septentrionalis TaxID=34720 RepID=A0A151JV22_9HYME|nr:hypothetical protein ALC56_09073 [Trachymyrmex septentrionalis]